MSCFFTLGFSIALACALPSQLQPEGAADNEPRDHLTAEDVLKALQKQRPENQAIPPSGSTAPDAGAARRALLPEGSRVVNRSGSLLYDGLWWTFVFDNGADMPRMKLLPNATLEPMVRTLTGWKAGPGSATLRFEVSGEATVFEGENYLLPRVAMRSSIAGVPGPALAGATPQVLTAPDVPNDAVRPPFQPVNPPPVRQDAEPEEVLKLLQAQRPAQEAIRPGVDGRAPNESQGDRGATQTPSPSAPEVRSSTAEGSDRAGWALIADGSPLVERAGRVIRRGDWWTFVFESDHPGHPEPPMKLLPCKNLELMVQAVERGTPTAWGTTPTLWAGTSTAWGTTHGLVFIISGQVSVFNGENYLLPRVVRRRINSGNLGR